MKRWFVNTFFDPPPAEAIGAGMGIFKPPPPPPPQFEIGDEIEEGEPPLREPEQPQPQEYSEPLEREMTATEQGVWRVTRRATIMRDLAAAVAAGTVLLAVLTVWLSVRTISLAS